jgi:hypothetical protein
MPTLSKYIVDGISIVTEVFIETGLYKGASLQKALWQGYKELHSIEVHRPHVEAGRIIFGQYRNVFIHHGSSPDILPHIMDPLKSTTFWLDGHYQSVSLEEIDPKAGQCPLMQELAAISAVPWRTKPIVIIDDVHMYRRPWKGFNKGAFDESQWPTLEEVVAALPGYRLYEQDSILHFLPVQSQ